MNVLNKTTPSLAAFRVFQPVWLFSLVSL